METGKASKTALRVAIRRAAHQLMDKPPVLSDPLAVRLLGPGYVRDMERAMHTVARDFRLFMATRSRFAEDHLAESVGNGVRQYVVLGAGLDTFAYRNPFPHLRVFEVDFPATQEWKRGMLAEAEIAPPETMTFVPLDFEHQTLAAGLADAGFDACKPAFFSWLGVVPYLTLEGFRATLAAIANLPAGTGVSFDYVFSPDSFGPKRRQAFDVLAARVAAAGEPFQLFFSEEQLEQELRSAGFNRIEQVDPKRLNELYFTGRADGLKLSGASFGRLVAAWL